METRTLTMVSNGASKEANRRITLSLSRIVFMSVDETPVMLQESDFKRVEITYDTGITHELILSDYDISTIEEVIGSYSFE